MPASTDHVKPSLPECAHRVRLGNRTGQHVRFDGKQHPSGLQCGNHALQGLAGRREMVKQSASHDQVVVTLFDCILKDIDATDFKTRHLQPCHISDIDVARHHVAARRNAPSQSLRDRSVTTTKFQATPAWTHAEPRQAILSSGSSNDDISARRCCSPTNS